MERDEIRRAAALDRSWDAMVHGDSASAIPADIEEDVAEILDAVRSLGARAPLFPDPEQGWRDLVKRPDLHEVLTEGPRQGMRMRRDREETTMVHSGILPSLSPPIGVNGWVDALPEPGRRRIGTGRQRWMSTQVVTAALLALSLVAGMFAFGPWRPGRSDSPPSHYLAAISATPEAGQFEFLWRSTGGPDSIDHGYGLGIDPEGNIWVAEGNKDRFQILDPDGTYRETWGTPGSGDGELEFLSTASFFGRAYGDIAFDAEGNFYVADTGNFRVQKFAPDRTFLRAWGSKGKEDGQFLAPNSIAIGMDGVVYVTDEARADVQLFDPDGQYVGTIGEKGTDDGQFSVPGGVAIDASGDFWVADWGSKQIQHFTSSGTWLDTWGQPVSGDAELRNPNDVAVDDLGRVYVVADFSGQLHAYSADGRLLAMIGGFGSGPGQFSDPLGIAVGQDRTVYVSDLNGVQAFRFVQP